MRNYSFHRGFGLGVLALSAFGCADAPYNPNAPAVDPNAPKIHITTPALGTIAGDVHVVQVSGTASDDTAVASVTVNDMPATLAGDGSWSAMVPVTPGTNLIHAVAKDNSGNEGKATRAVVAGPQAPLANAIQDGLTATLSAETFAAIGKAAGGYLTSTDLEAMVAPHNPVFDAGGGPDCLYVMASVNSLTVGGADISLVPQAGGLHVDIELDNVMVDTGLAFAAACLDGSADIPISAQHVSITGDMAIGMNGSAFDIAFDNPNVTLTGVSLDLGGIPGEIVNILDINALLGSALGWAAKEFAVPMVNTALSNLGSVKTVNVMGINVDIQVSPSNIDFSSTGAIVELDSSMRAAGDNGQFVELVANAPNMDASHGFQLAVASNAANQLLTSLWSAKALDKTLALNNGSYGDIGKLYDSVEISAAVPPFVDASSGSLQMTVGDLIASFTSSGTVVTKVAISAQVDLKVDQATDGSLRLDVGTPTTYVDVLDDGVTGANELSNAQFDAIASFALARIVAVGAGSLGAIPLPSVGGVSVQNLSITEQTGYLIVAGAIQ